MFSGLKNQMNTWMHSSNPNENSDNPEGNDKNISKTFSKIGGYFPKLRKSDQEKPGIVASSASDDVQQHQHIETIEGSQDNNDVFVPVSVPVPVPIPVITSTDDADDHSSSTGGADSKPASLNDSPTESDVQFKDSVSKKAKTFSKFLYTAVNKAGKSVTEAGAKIKKTVEENSILVEFNREQETFLKTQQEKFASLAVLPWTNCSNENAVKEEVLSLSNDKRNFVKCPPTGIDFQFDYETYYPMALAIMNEDPNLEKMRFELVPKIISEENFWRNYFYRVNLISQASESSKINYQESLESQPGDSGDGEKEHELSDYEVIVGDENHGVNK